MTLPKAIQQKSPEEMCDGYFILNPVMDRYYLYPKGVSMDNYTLKESIGKTTYIDCNYNVDIFGYLSDDEKWGYIDFCLFTILDRYVSPSQHKSEWYHIRIESMI